MPSDTIERFGSVALKIGWVWAGFIIGVTVAAAYIAGPWIENETNPVFGVERLYDVERTADRLCWARHSEKLRNPDVQNYDVFLDYRSKRDSKIVHEFPAIFNSVTLEPISTERTPGVGITDRHFCIALSPYIRTDQPIRLRQTVHFRGFLGLWDLPVGLPTIVSPPESVLPR